MLARYRGTKALTITQVTDSDQIHSDRSITTVDSRFKGVLRGDPLDRIYVLEDLARIAAIRGEIGEVLADIECEVAEEEDKFVVLKATLYDRKARAIRNGVIEGKNTDESINNYVRMDDLYTQQQEAVRETKRAYSRFNNMYHGLLAVENALKKCLDHADR